jgi:hypothetical protein
MLRASYHDYVAQVQLCQRLQLVSDLSFASAEVPCHRRLPKPAGHVVAKLAGILVVVGPGQRAVMAVTGWECRARLGAYETGMHFAVVAVGEPNGAGEGAPAHFGPVNTYHHAAKSHGPSF